jgi:YD repeat-containing protein
MTEPSPAEAIFFAALEKLTEAERTAFLEQACAGDRDLRRQIARLLAAHARAGAFLERPIAEAADLAELAEQDTPPRGPESAGSRRPPVPGHREPLDFLAASQRPDALGRLGHYDVLDVVGKGGMGIVLRAFDGKLHRVVAVKVLNPQLATATGARERFVREARAAAAVTHDHVVAIYAVEDEGPVPYLVMQFIDGHTLQEQLDRTGPPPMKEIVRIGIQTAAGLAAAHRLGMVHRDVKPANILLERSTGRVKITDFGLARAVEDTSLTQSGIVAGTPAYMSPEQANGVRVDLRSDLFSLGSVLYTLCAGHEPFRAGTAMAVLKRVCEEAPRPLRDANPNVPDWLEAVIARLHAKNTADRFQTATEVVEILARHQAQLEQRSSATAVVSMPASRPRGKRFPRVAALLLLVLGMAILGASVAAYRLRRRDDEAGGPAVTDAGRPNAPTVQPLTSPAPEKWTTLKSPLDAVKRETLDLPANTPPEILALVGDSPIFRLPERADGHWMAQSRDGRLLAVPCGANILLYEANTGKLIRTLTGHTGRAYRPTFSPDGERLAAGSDNGFLRVWDVPSGRELVTRQDPGHTIWAVAYDADGKRLVSADATGTLTVWDAQGRQTHRFAAHTKGVNQLAFRPDGKRLATASLDGTCKLWDPDTWNEVRALSAKGKTFEAVAWSPNGRLLAAGDDAQVIVWNAETYAVLHTLPTPGKGLLAFGRDERTLFTARHDCGNREIHAFTRWDLKTETPKTAQMWTFGGVACFHLSPDGRTVYAVCNPPVNMHVQAIEAERGTPRFQRRGHARVVESVAFSPDGRTLASGSQDATVRLWNLAGWKAGEPQPPFRVLVDRPEPVIALAFSPDGSRLATMSMYQARICLWDVASGRKLHALEGPMRHWTQMAFTPDGRTLASGAVGRLNLWDVQTGHRDESPAWNDGPVYTVAFSLDGRLLACGGMRSIQVIDRVAGRRLYNFRGERMFSNLAFSPDGRILAATTNGLFPQLRLWDMATGEEQPARVSPGDTLVGLAFHPGGRLVATTAWSDTRVHLWDVKPSAKEVRSFDLRGVPPQRIAFSPDGRYLAVGLEDGTIAIVRVTAEPAAR